MKPGTWNLNLPPVVETTMLTLLQAMEQQRVVERLWQRDASLWHPSAQTQSGIVRRLGWLDGPDAGLPAQVRSLGLSIRRPTLLIAPDDAGGAARLWLDSASREVSLLDSWAPRAVEQALEPDRQAVVVAADRSSPALDALLAATGAARSAAQLATVAPPALLASLGNPPRALVADETAGARFGALGSYGLLAAALAGRDIEAIAGGARAMLDACREGSGSNPGLRLGAVLAALAQHGYDLLQLSAEAGTWAVADWIAGLLAGALGKHRRGFVPLVEPRHRPWPPAQQPARIVVGAAQGEAARAQPFTIEFPIAGDGDTGALVALWQLAVAVAAIVIGVNPFDEPDTLAFERRLRQHAAGELPAKVFSQPLPSVEPLELPPATRWLAVVPYVAVNSGNIEQLGRLRSLLRRRSGRPVTLVEPLRHGWATQLLHAGRPDGFVLALPPPAGTSELDELVRARFELDIAAWERMGREFAVLQSI